MRSSSRGTHTGRVPGLVLALALLPASVPAQVPAQAPAGVPPAPLLQRLEGLKLPSSRNEITVHYAEEHRDRALRMRAFVEDAMRFYEKELGIRQELHLAVLGPGHWKALDVGQPYGIPGVAGTPAVAFLPATDDNLAANDALGIRPGVSAATMRRIEGAGLTYDEAARRYVDLVALHEVGHTSTRVFGIRPPRRWVGELLATYFAYAYLREREPKQAQVWDGLLDAYLDAVQPAHTTLADFDRLYFGVGARNYVWYQGRFQQVVREVYDARGLGVLRQVREAFPANDTAEVPPDEVLRRLVAIHPAFARADEARSNGGAGTLP